MRFFYLGNMAIEKIYQHFLKYPLICTDSRKIESNSLFFALKGGNFNGNEFALNALNSGAKFSIVDDVSLKNEEKCIWVEDVLNTLQQLANHHRLQLKIPIIGITGTNGKTTTKELIACVLKRKYKIVATLGNLNNHIGVPLTLLSLNKDTDIGIIEMGANHVGEIDMLCKIAVPDFGLITNIGKAHLEGFGSFSGVIQAKTELYKYIESKQGTIFFNADNNLLVDQLSQIKCKKVDYGTSENNSCKGRQLDSDQFLKFEVILKCPSGEEFKKNIQSNLVGAYNLENALAATCIGNYFGVSVNDIAEAINDYLPSNNRSQLLQTVNNQLVIDYYNANPSSMEVAIRNFHKLKQTLDKKVIILGEMLELGNYSSEEHSKLLELLIKLEFKNVLLVGKEFNVTSSKGFTLFKDSLELSMYLKRNKIVNSQILIKGSRGVKLEKALEWL